MGSKRSFADAMAPLEEFCRQGKGDRECRERDGVPRTGVFSTVLRFERRVKCLRTQKNGRDIIICGTYQETQ